MDNELLRNVRRWRGADEEGHDEDADAACRAVFADGLTDRPLSLEFVTRTMDAVAAAAVEDGRRARRVRTMVVTGGVAGSLAAAYFAGRWALASAASLVLGMLDLLVGATVRFASGVQAGADMWSVLSSVGRGVAAFVSDPSVTIVMLAMQGMAIAALYALQRLLGSDTESLK